MANILKSFFSQCARPEGALGRVMLSFMNYTHAPLTNWGLKLMDVQDGWTMLDVGCGGGFTIRRLLKAASKRGQSPLGIPKGDATGRTQEGLARRPQRGKSTCL